jgi:hypothetical protein
LKEVNKNRQEISKDWVMICTKIQLCDNLIFSQVLEIMKSKTL